MAGFRSTASPPEVRAIKPGDQFLVDPATGAPVGIANSQGTGQDGQFYPVPLTAAQIASPTAEMIADTKVTYCLNVAPYTRYMSNGTTLVGLSEDTVEREAVGIFANLSTIPADTPALTIGANSQAVIYGSETVQSSNGLTVNGTLRVYNWP